MNMKKKEIIEEIKKLISTNKDESIEINPNFLEYFELEELLSIKEGLEVKKSTFSQISSNYLDELYEKTKKDEL